MVEELLEFSKIEDGRFTPRVEQMDPQAEVEGRHLHLPGAFSARDGIDLEYSNAGEMFEQPITGDPERLKQVLLQCAEQCRQARRLRQRITVSMEQDGEWYVVQVRDYGPASRRRSCPM